MAFVDVCYLQKLFKYIGTTACGETESFISAAITNNWTKEIAKNRSSKDYFNDVWNGIKFSTYDNSAYGICHITCAANEIQISGADLNPKLEFTAIDIMELITSAISKYGYLSLGVDFKHDHVLTLCNTESGIVIIDSYIGQREAEIRPLDEYTLYSLLENPTSDNYNKFCKCSHPPFTSRQLVIDFMVPSGKEIVLDNNKVII